MKCSDMKEKISQALDNELPDSKRSELDAHLAGCPACRQLMEHWTAQAQLLKAMDATPPAPAEVTWQNVRRAIRSSAPQGRSDTSSAFGWRVRWAGAMFAAVFVGILVVGTWRIATVQRTMDLAGERGADVEWVEAELPGASPMVYEDAETGWTVIWMMVAENGKSDPRGS